MRGKKDRETALEVERYTRDTEVKRGTRTEQRGRRKRQVPVCWPSLHCRMTLCRWTGTPHTHIHTHIHTHTCSGAAQTVILHHSQVIVPPLTPSLNQCQGCLSLTSQWDFIFLWLCVCESEMKHRLVILDEEVFRWHINLWYDSEYIHW